jgi:hypothetical protein
MAAQGVSFRLAVELLRQDSPALDSIAPVSPLSSGRGPVGKSSSRKLPPIAEPSVEDHELAGAVIAHYAETLASSPEALGFLARRRIDHPEAVETLRLGYANRTLGYRLGPSQTKAGGALRARLQALGFLRSSGHEHFTGSLVVPVLDEHRRVGEVYGRKVAEQRLRSGTPLHLYLPGPHRGVFNLSAFADVDELIVTESLLDALSFWCAGYRHVTATYGTGGWTIEHAAAVQAYGIRRVLLAFDADEAGDKGAAAIAQELMGLGVECFRVELPRGADVNDVAVQAASPREALGRFLRKASWMGTGPSPATVVHPAARPVEFRAEPVEAPEVAEAANHIAVQGDPSPEAEDVVHDEPVVVPPEVASPVPRPPSQPGSQAAAEVEVVGAGVGTELRLRFGDRAWRVRGLERVTSFETLRVNVLVARADRAEAAAHAFHVDTLDLYSARARGVFVTQAAAELRLEAEVVKSDLGRVLLACGARAEEVIQAANEPAVTEVTVTGAAREQALALLRDPNLMTRVEEAFTAVGWSGRRRTASSATSRRSAASCRRRWR